LRRYSEYGGKLLAARQSIMALLTHCLSTTGTKFEVQGAILVKQPHESHKKFHRQLVLHDDPLLPKRCRKTNSTNGSSRTKVELQQRSYGEPIYAAATLARSKDEPTTSGLPTF